LQDGCGKRCFEVCTNELLNPFALRVPPTLESALI